jgi:hypothetical protein
MLGRFKMPIAIFLLLVVVAWQRGQWAQVAQWREDQACNLWIGYVQPVMQLPVGLISSVKTPNPNGMPLLAELLSRLPSLWAISTVLGFVQGALAVWVCSLLMRTPWRFLLVALPVSTSLIVSATSVEFWNNWILVSFDLAFFACYMTYQRTRSLWPITGCVLLMLLAPAVYLAGLVNALVYFVFVVSVLVRHPPLRRSWIGLRGNVPPVLAAVCVVGGLMIVTWLPYAEVMRDQSLPSLNAESPPARLVHVVEAALDFPRWSLMHWYRQSRESFLQSDDDILGERTDDLLTLADILSLAQSLLAAFVLALAVLRRVRLAPTARAHGFFVPGKAWHGRMVLAALAFVWLSMLISPLIGGPDWTRSERVDQQTQFLPFILIASFALPQLLQLPAWIRSFSERTTVLLAVAFTLVNFVAGNAVVQAHLRYDGDELTRADIPVVQQQEVARFMAEDWRRVSTSDKIPVFYKHGQDWVIDFGRALLPYYPAPMAVGRAIDFQLSRAHGLRNAQEGIQRRSSRHARYIVTYMAHAAPDVAPARVTHHKVGRLRVSIVER